MTGGILNIRKIISVLTGLCVFTSLATRLVAQQTIDRPNVIIVLTDDQGFGDFSATGNPVLQTPHLDSLRAHSIRFSNFHVSPLCTPSRGELMTGLDALHNGACTVGTGRDFLRRDIVTMPEVFLENGYRTGIFGKWHLGDNYPDRPMDRGFQKCIWFRGWGLLSESEFDNDYYHTRYMDSLTVVKSDKYCTDLWFDEAIHWMTRMHRDGKPFFAYIATNAPHGPLYAPRKDMAFYRDKVPDLKTAKFFGMIRDIDRNMNKLDQWMTKEQLKRNTVVVFMNDNGGTAGVDLYNAGMRGKKGSNYDGGHRAVCFVRWPEGGLAAPYTVESLAEVQDIFPTMEQLCNLRPTSQPLDGVSLVPELKGKKGDTDRMVVVQYGGDNRPEEFDGCVLWKDWRLVGRNELYLISHDSGEQHNLAATNPAIRDSMRAFYDRWWETLPDWDHFIPLIVGSESENPVTLTSDYWADSQYVNTQWKVALAGGAPRGGIWHVRAEQKGTYRFELSRWPPRLRRPLSQAGPDTAEGGTRIRAGKNVPVHAGCLSIDGQNPLVGAPADERSSGVVITTKMSKGDHTLAGWFRDGKGEDLCGAYYLKVTWVPPDR